MNTYVATTGNGQVEIHQNAVPEPDATEVVVKVFYAAITPFDLYQVDIGFLVQPPHTIIAVDASGVVHKVGSSVTDLKVGDRVAVFAVKPPRGKGMQEYTIVPRHVVTKIPDSISLEEASSLSGNAITAFHTLFDRLELPWQEEFPKHDNIDAHDLGLPILIYGAGSSSGQYMVQMLGIAGYKNIVAVASSRHDQLLRSSGAAHVIDYRSTSFAEDVTRAVGERKIKIVVDCVALDDSFVALSKVVAPDATYAYLKPIKRGGDISGKGSVLADEPPKEVTHAFPKDVKFLPVGTFYFDKNERVAKALAPSILPRLLERGLIKPNDTATFQEGSLLDRVNGGLNLLRANETNGRKVVIKVVD